jgi:hypothetical protein
MVPRTIALCFLTGLLAPAIAVAAVVQTGGEPLAVPPLPVPPASAAHDPDAVCAAALGGSLAGQWMLCRLPTGEEAAALSRRSRAQPFYHAILLRRYGGERMADLATEAAMETYRRLSDRARDRRIDACVERARSGR